MIEAYESDPFLWIFQMLIGPIITISVAMLLGLIVERIILAALQKLAEKSSWQGDDLIIGVLRGNLTFFWFLLLGIFWATQNAGLSSKNIQIIHQMLLIVFILSLIVVVSRIIIALIDLEPVTGKNPVPSILNNLIRIFIYIIGFLFILQTLEVEITPLIAAIGAGSLGVSFALQNTLENLFSGIQITVAQRINPGDYVRLTSGEEGYVKDINWNNMQIQRWDNNTVVVPNSMLTSAILTNFHSPKKWMLVWVDIGVSYASDLEEVERITLEVTQELLEARVKDGALYGGDFSPFIRYNTFSEFRVNFAVFFYIKEFMNQYLIKHELIKCLHKRYRQEGIDIPFPTRVLHHLSSNGEQMSGHMQPSASFPFISSTKEDADTHTTTDE